MLFGLIPETYAAEFAVSDSSLNQISSGAIDVVNSAFNLFGDVLLVVIPLIIFAIGFAMLRRVVPRM